MPAANVISVQPEPFTCDMTNMDLDLRPPSRIPTKKESRCAAINGILSSDGNTCTWDRRLCVTCRRDGPDVYIRVQTNDLPDHCIKSSSVKPQYFDFEVLFDSGNPATDPLANNFASQDELNHEVCHLHKDYSDDLQITELNQTAHESRRAMGFALNGVAFQFANQIDEDPVAPVSELNEQPLDVCMGHNQLDSTSGMYHYHSVSPCINSAFLTTGPRADPAQFNFTECRNHSLCEDNKFEWVQSGFPSHSGNNNRWHKAVIGLSKDGRPIYGPWDGNGDEWAAQNVDACNGVLDGDDYYYVGTAWHPYAVGCQGPSNSPHTLSVDPMFPNCSTNGIEHHI